MTKQEAIEWLHVLRTGWICDPKECGHKQGSDICRMFHCDDKHDALAIAIECIEKQIPKKPVLENTKGILGIDMWHCPVCKDEIISDWNRDIANPYCHHCGQAIDWSDNE